MSERDGPTTVSLDDVLSACTAGPDRYEPVTASEVAEKLGCARRTAYNKLQTLASRGALETKKTGARSRVWWRSTEAVRAESTATAGDRRDRFERLGRVNAVIRRVTQSIVRAETRAELEQAVCDSLADSDPYLFAVSGEFSPSYDEYVPRATAGEGTAFLEAILDRPDAPPVSETIGAEAARTGDVYVRQNLAESPYEHWARAAAEQGILSFAAVPFVDDEFVYGVMGVYADRSNAFDREEREILAELGETVGHALSGLERTEIRDPAVELTFVSEPAARTLVDDPDERIEIEIESIVPLQNGNSLQYWTVAGISVSAFTERVRRLPPHLDTRLLSVDGDEAHFEVLASQDSLFSKLVSFDGRHKSATASRDEFVIVAEFERSVDTEAVLDAAQEVYPELELVSERAVLTPTFLRRLLEDALTDRQLTALRMAYFAGYFEQPRDSTGEELAAQLDITPQTFHHHLRNAQAEVFDRVFETDEYVI